MLLEDKNSRRQEDIPVSIKLYTMPVSIRYFFFT